MWMFPRGDFTSCASNREEAHQWTSSGLYWELTPVNVSPPHREMKNQNGPILSANKVVLRQKGRPSNYHY